MKTSICIAIALLFAVLSHSAHAVIIQNTTSGRFVRIGSNGTLDGDNLFHIAEAVVFGVSGSDLALTSAGASATTTFGTGGHGSVNNVINGTYDTASA